MLDALEAGISALQSQCVSAPTSEAGASAVITLQAELRAAGISTVEFARLVCVPPETVEGWTTGAKIAPTWVPAAIRLVALLTPSARHKALYGAARAHVHVAGATHSHPFSRIEEL